MSKLIADSDGKIREEFRRFAHRIFEVSNSELPEVVKELEDFCADNNVTFDQLQEFTYTGAGEMLYMLGYELDLKVVME